MKRDTLIVIAENDTQVTEHFNEVYKTAKEQFKSAVSKIQHTTLNGYSSRAFTIPIYPTNKERIKLFTEYIDDLSGNRDWNQRVQYFEINL